MNLKRALAILEIDKAASFWEVKQSYRDLAAIWHPDRFSHNARIANKSQEKMKEINAAYRFLATRYANPDRPDPKYKPMHLPEGTKYLKACLGIALIATSLMRKKNQ